MSYKGNSIDSIGAELIFRNYLRSEYQLTELGKSLLPVIDFMEDWGDYHRGHFENL